MIVHPGSNVGVVIGFGATPVGGLTYANTPNAATTVESLSNTPALSPTLAQLNGP